MYICICFLGSWAAERQCSWGLTDDGQADPLVLTDSPLTETCRQVGVCQW